MTADGGQHAANEIGVNTLVGINIVAAVSANSKPEPLWITKNLAYVKGQGHRVSPARKPPRRAGEFVLAGPYAAGQSPS